MINIKHISDKTYQELVDDCNRLTEAFDNISKQNEVAGDKLKKFNYSIQHRIIDKQKLVLKEMNHRVEVEKKEFFKNRKKFELKK